jgi:hypothetical protein
LLTASGTTATTPTIATRTIATLAIATLAIAILARTALPGTGALRTLATATAPRHRTPLRATLATLLEPLTHLVDAFLDALMHLGAAVAAFAARHHTLSALFVSFGTPATATALRRQGDREQ